MAILGVDNDASCIITHAYQPCLLQSAPAFQYTLGTRCPAELKESVQYVTDLNMVSGPSFACLFFKGQVREYLTWEL